MRIRENESVVFETQDGSQFRVGVDAECGDHGIKITALDGKIFSATTDANQLMVKVVRK